MTLFIVPLLSMFAAGLLVGVCANRAHVMLRERLAALDVSRPREISGVPLPAPNDPRWRVESVTFLEVKSSGSVMAMGQRTQDPTFVTYNCLRLGALAVHPVGGVYVMWETASKYKFPMGVAGTVEYGALVQRAYSAELALAAISGEG